MKNGVLAFSCFVFTTLFYLPLRRARRILACVLFAAIALTGLTQTVTLQTGYNFVGCHVNGTGGNNVNNTSFLQVSPSLSDPNGINNATLYVWNCTSFSVYQYYTAADAGSGSDGWYDASGNLANVTWNPGRGMIIRNFDPPATITFNGSPVTPVLPPTNYCGCDTWSLLSPQTTNFSSTYQDVTGFAPQEGSKVSYSYPTNGTILATDTYSNGAWAPSTPILTNGASAFFFVPCATNTVSTNCCDNCTTNNYVSYTNTVVPGDNYLADNLCQGTNNTLDEVLPDVPDGTTFLSWNGATFDPAQTYFAGFGWYDNNTGNNSTNTLMPGEGFVLQNSSGATFTIVIRGCEPNCPPPCSPASGMSLVGRLGIGTASWTNLFSCPPPCGARMSLWNGTSFTDFDFANGAWTPYLPILGIGQSAFVSVQPNTNCIPCTNNLVINGGFELTSPAVPPNTANNQLSATTGVPGWTTTAGNTLEVWGNVVNNLPAAEGSNHMEINAQSNDQTVFQVLTNLDTNCPATFYFNYTGRFGIEGTTYNNDFTVTLSTGTIITGDILSSDLDPTIYSITGWTNFYFSFIPTSPTVTIAFRGHPHYTNGVQTEGGAHIDNVLLAQCCTNPCITLTCATNKTVQCGTTWNFDAPANIVDTCCTNYNVSFSTVTNNVPCPLAITRTWFVSDACGNSNTCSQTVTLVDTTPPVITASPAGGSLGCNPGGASLPTDASIKLQVKATDNCSLSTTNVTHLDGGTLCSSNRTFTITVTDGCGNIASTNAVYTWTTDTTKPVFISSPIGGNLGCNPAPSSLPTDAGVKAQVAATDNCILALTNVTHLDGGTACNSNRTFTITVTDACGNVASTNAVYSWIVDTTPPTLTCSSNKTVPCGAAWNFDAPAATDLCSGTNVTVSILTTVTNGICPQVITRTWLAADLCGNTNTCSQTVTIISCTPPPSGMTLWLPFDETSGTTSVNLAGGNNGTQINGPSVNLGSYVANSLCFDGTNDYVEVTDYSAINIGTGDFSVDAWVKPAILGNNTIQIIVDHRAETGSTIGYSLFLGNNNNLGFQIGDGGFINYPSTFFVPVDGQWHHVAVTVKRNNPQGIHFFMDGVVGALGRDPTPYSGSITPPPSYPFRVGSRSSSVDGFFNGCIDEVEVFNRELGTNEVQSLFNTGPAGKCKSPKLVCSAPKSVPCGTLITFDQPIVNDPCSGSNTAVAPFGPDMNGGTTCAPTVTRTWLYVDSCGYSNFCSQIVTVIDTNSPVITNPTNLTVDCGTSWNFTTPTAVDPCGISNIVVIPQTPLTNGLCPTVITETWIASNLCNGLTATATQTVAVVNPNTACPPLLSRPGIASITVWEQTGGDIAHSFLVSDPKLQNPIVGGPTSSTYDFASTSSEYYDLYLSDPDGTPNVNGCSVTIVCDSTASSQNFATGDNIDAVELNFSSGPSIGASSIGNIQLGSDITDPGLLASSGWATNALGLHDANSTRLGNNLSRITLCFPTDCSTAKTVQCGTNWTFDPPAAFNACCGSNVIVSVLNTVTNGTACDLVILRTWEVTDCCSNKTTCTETVSVVDTTPPNITCKTNTVVVALNNNCQLVIPAVSAFATDNCTPASQLVFKQSPPKGTIVSGTSQVVTVTVVDLCGNSNHCQVKVVGLDKTGPILTVPKTLVVSNCVVPCVSNLVSAIDNCCPQSSIKITQSPPCNTLLGPGINSITVTATDCHGNSTTKIIHLTVLAPGSFLSSLFNSGVDNTHAPLTFGATDGHYVLTPLGTTPTCFPGHAVAVKGPWTLPPASGIASDWIAPCINAANNCPTVPAEYYKYSYTFTLPAGSTPSTASISGRWAAGQWGYTSLNGGPYGAPYGTSIPSGVDGSKKWTYFTISAGFVAGANTLDFYVFNSGGPNGLRVEYTSATVCATCAPPSIVSITSGHSIPNNGIAALSVSSAGTPPLSYQWYRNGVILQNISPYSGVKTANLLINPIHYANAGLYTVVISNACGSVTGKVNLSVSAGLPWSSGWWNVAQLDNPLAATVGPDLNLVGTSDYGTNFTITAGTTEDFGLPDLGGQIVNVMHVASLPADTSIQVPLIAPPGSNSVNSYSLIMDLYQPADSAGTSNTLFQSMACCEGGGLGTNGQDGVGLTIDAQNNLHVTGSAAGVPFDVASAVPLPTDAWNRVALVVDDPQDGFGVNLFLYLNGQPLASLTVPTATGLPINWSISPPTLLSRQTNDVSLNGEFYISSIQFHAVALAPEQLAGIGSPDNGSAPANDPSVGPQPMLSAALANGSVSFSWTGNSFVLQETTDLASGDWIDSELPFTESADGSTTTTTADPSMEGSSKFYRLIFRP
jgi:hypothetical protein